MSDLKTIEKEKADAIFNSLKKKFDGLQSIGLFSGKAGLVLSFFEYAKTHNEFCSNEEIIEYMQICIDQLQELDLCSPTFCSGIAGIAYVLRCLDKDNVFSDISDVLTTIDDFLEVHCRKLIDKNDFDFLHGATGIIFYFSSFPNTNKEIVIRKYIKSLEGVAICKEDIIYLISNLYPNQTRGINLGLSHGISAITTVLLRIMLQGIETESSKNLIIGFVNFILNVERNPQMYGSYFPSWITENTFSDEKSRLAWCYGDLGIAVCLFNCGKYLNKKKLIEKSISIFEYSAKNRRSLLDNYVIDGAICHGTIGIAYIFYYMYKETNNPVFKSTANYWVEKTIEIANDKEGIEGYRFFFGEQGWVNSCGLLEGVLGIGLGLDTITNNRTSFLSNILLLKV